MYHRANLNGTISRRDKRAMSQSLPLPTSINAEGPTLFGMPLKYIS